MLKHINKYSSRSWPTKSCCRLRQEPVAIQHLHWQHQRQRSPWQQHAAAHLHCRRPRQQAVLADVHVAVSAVPPVYDRQQIQQLFASRPDLAIGRAVQVLTALAKLVLLQMQRSPAAAADASYAASVRQLVSELGVLWVKLGQTLSVRPDLVGSRLAAALAGLQEGSPPFDKATAAAIVVSDLGRRPSELFAWMSPTPVASASLGQVYQARLALDGTLVAVKVQRPDVWPQLQADLAVLLLLLRLLRWAGRVKQDISLWADTLGKGLAQELDYQQEAHNLELFAAAHSQLSFVTTPAVVWELTSHRVLTTTWVNGQTPGQILRQARTAAVPSATAAHPQHATQPGQQQHQRLVTSVSEEPQQQLLQLVTMGVEASLCQLVTTGVLHADPHPGNLLLTPQGQLAYIDFGLLVQVPPAASLAMMSALLHWALTDWCALANDLGAMGLLKQSTDRAQLAVDLEQQFTKLYAAAPATDLRRFEDDSTATGVADVSKAAGGQGGEQQQQQSLLRSKAGAISFGDFAGVIAALALKYRFELPPYYTLVVRSLTTLEGFALLADPGARNDIARAAVRAIARQLLTDQRPAAQQLLCEVLRSPTTGGCINLPLLQELLSLQRQPQLQQQQQGRSWMQQQQQQQQPWMGLLLQKFDAARLAQQLSSAEAADVRAVAVQRLFGGQKSAQEVHQQHEEGTIVYQQHNMQQQAEHFVERESALHASRAGNKQTGSNSGKQEVLLVVLRWLLRAGWRGLVLAVQVSALAVMVRAKRALAAVFAASQSR